MYPHYIGLHPTRRESLSRAPFTDDPLLGELTARFESGRAYPAGSIWGVIERQLPRTLADIWQAYLRNPDGDLDNLLDKHLNQLARRLAITLQR